MDLLKKNKLLLLKEKSTLPKVLKETFLDELFINKESDKIHDFITGAIRILELNEKITINDLTLLLIESEAIILNEKGELELTEHAKPLIYKSHVFGNMQYFYISIK